MNLFKNIWFWVAIVSLLILGVAGWWALSGDDEPDTTNTDTNTAVTAPVPSEIDPISDPLPEAPSEDTTEITDTAPPSIEYEYFASLTDVSGGNGEGIAQSVFSDGTYTLEVLFQELPEPEGSDFYEGWVVRKSPLSVISTGKAEIQDLNYVNNFTSTEDLTDHTQYVLTLEPDDGDPAPAEHILEGNFSSQ